MQKPQRRYLIYKTVFRLIPANIYLFKVNNRNTRKRCELCSKLIMKTPERCHWRRFNVCIVNFKHISHLFVLFLLLPLNKHLFVGMFLSRLWSNESWTLTGFFTFAPSIFLILRICVCSCFRLPHVSRVLHALLCYKHLYASLLPLFNQLFFLRFKVANLSYLLFSRKFNRNLILIIF